MATNLWIGIMEDPTLKEVLSEVNKAPGGNVPYRLPAYSGPKLGGPKEEYKPGIVDPATGVRSKSDTAIELFRFYAFGKVKKRNLPEPPPDTKKVEVTEIPMSPEEKRERKFRKEAGVSVQQTELRRKKNIAIKQGTVGGMTRPIGSKPPIDLTVNMRAAIERTAQLVKLREEAQVIRAALEKAFGAVGSEAPEFEGKYTPELERTTKAISREEEKYLNLLQRRIQDAKLSREAALAEAEMEAGRSIPQFEDWKAMQEAEQRTLEGRQAAERTRISRKKTESSLKNLPDLKDLPGKLFGGKGGTGLASLDFISMILSANLMFEQMLLEDSRRKKELQQPN